MPVRVREQQDRLLWMIHRAVGEAGLVIGNECNAIRPRNVLGGDDHELIPGDSGAKRDFPDLAAGNFAAYGCAMEHPGQSDVVDVLRAAGDLVAPLFARNGGADDGLSIHANWFRTSCPSASPGNSPS